MISINTIMKVSAVVLVVTGIVAVLLPSERITSLKKQWEPATWAVVMNNNHNTISACYGYLEDKNYKAFQQTCSVSYLIETENLVHSSYASAKSKYPDLTDQQFLSRYFDDKTTIIVLSHFSITEEFKMTLMILIFAEPLVPLYV